MRGRFIVGYSVHRVFGNQSYSVVDAGGAAYVTLTSDQSVMPYHSHEATGTIKEAGGHDHGTFGAYSLNSPYGLYSPHRNYWGSTSGVNTSAYTFATSSNGSHRHDISITTKGVKREIANKGHENRPPYYALYYIMKL